MEIRTRYDGKEVSTIILDHHLKTFGAAPAGEQWGISGGYDGRTIENEKPEEPETPKPEAPKEA
jgi:hypothetical protein